MKKTIIKLRFLTRLKKAEHFNLIESIVSGTKGALGKDPLAGGLWSALAGCFVEEKRFFMPEAHVESTHKIQQLRRRRAKAFLKLKLAIRIAGYNKLAERQQAAASFDALLNDYRKLSYPSYAQDTDMISAFLGKITGGCYDGAIKLLKLEGLIGNLEKENETFKEVYSHRSIHAYSIEKERLAKARRKCDEALRRMADETGRLCRACLPDESGREEAEKLAGALKLVEKHCLRAESVYNKRIFK